jgi:hypothetical protein
VGLSTHAGIPYQSLAHLVDACASALEVDTGKSGAAA